MAICTRHCRTVAACSSWITTMGAQNFLASAYATLKTKINTFRTNWLLSSYTGSISAATRVYASDWNTKVRDPINAAAAVGVGSASAGGAVAGLSPDYAIGRMNTSKCTVVCASYCTGTNCSCESDCGTDCGATCTNCGATCTDCGSTCSDCGVTCGATCGCLGCDTIAD